MQKPDINEYTHLLSSLKSEIQKIKNRGFPEDGSYSVDEWAEIWNVTADTIRRWVKDFKIPVWGPSDKCYFVEAADFRGVFQKRTI